MGEMLQNYGINTKSNFVSMLQEKFQESELCGLYAI